jgi:glycosyltransferase involved in cell wall biosynthesis
MLQSPAGSSPFAEVTTLDVSVVVCSYNGAAHLPAVLASLREQTIDARRCETLVVDDGSSDPTSAVASV